MRNPWLFKKTSEYLQKIIFSDQDDSVPSLHNNAGYSYAVQSRIDQMITSPFFKDNFTKDEVEQEMKSKKVHSIRHTISRQISSICLSEQVEDIKHADEKSDRLNHQRSYADTLPTNLKFDFSDRNVSPDQQHVHFLNADFLLSKIFGYQCVTVK